jgi:uncharacterized alkaline shock family protein YloU
MNSASSGGGGGGSNAGHDTERQGGSRTAQAQAPSSSSSSSSRPSSRSGTAHPEAWPSAGVSLTTENGNTRIGDGVVAKIAGLAARDIPGVYSMGNSMARRVGQLRALIPGGSEAATQGVSVEVGEREAAIDLNVVTWYGQSIVEISEAVRRNVIGQIEGMTGLDVIEVNVQVDDIHVETPEDSRQAGPAQQRVQ